MLTNIVNKATAIVGKRRPFILYHKPTAKCDCRCIFCNFWKIQPSGNDILPTPKIISLLNKARAARMTTYTIWGGEPLLVEDLAQWLSHAKKIGLQTIICSSGYRLYDRAKEINNNLDLLLLSLESIGEEHNRIRGKKNLFKTIIKGIEEFRKLSKGRITIWSNIGRFNRDQVVPIAKFAEEQKLNVEFFPTTLYRGYNDALVLDTKEREEVFSRILDLKEEGFPILNTTYSLKLMKTSRPFRCNITTVSILVNPDGMIYPCEPRLVSDTISYVNIEKVDFKKLFDSNQYAQSINELSSCNRCLLPCVGHMADNLFLQSFRRFLNNLRYY